MILAKYGSPPADQPLPFVNWPVIHLDGETLRRLEGSYRGSDSTITVQEKEGTLYLGGTQPLRPYEPTGFTTEEGARVTFHLDARGRPDEMQILDRWGYSRYPIDHSSTDDPGPNEPGWGKYTGLYTTREDGLFFFATVTIKNGYLYLAGWIGEAKLTEYKPGLFFTADGEAIIFEDDKMIYGNGAVHVRENDPYRLALAQVDTNPDDRRLSKGALTRLSAAYRAMGEQEEADALLALCAKLHPNR